MAIPPEPEAQGDEVPSRPRAAFIGLTTLDLLQLVDEPVAPDVKLQATASLLTAGGPAANAAVTFTALGGDACLFSSFGTGAMAAMASNDLSAHNVSMVDFSAGSTADELPMSSVVVYAATGDRCVVSASGATRVPRTDATLELPDGLDVVLVDGHYAQATWGLIEDLPPTVPVIMDGGSWKEAAEPMLAKATAVICSADFRAPGTPGQDVARYLVDRGVQFAAVSRGGSEVEWRTPEASGSVRPPRVPVVDTLGAGDVLHGAFAYFLATQPKTNDVPVEQWVRSLERAVAVASLSCQFFGPRAWAAEWRRASATEVGEG